MTTSLPRIRFPLMTSVGAILIVVSLASPLSSATPPARIFTPPYHSATGFGYCLPGFLASCSSKLWMNTTTGNVSMAMYAGRVWAKTFCSPLTKACPAAQGRVGFEIPFRVLTNGTRNISANWFLHWFAKADCFGCGTARAYGELEIGLWDNTSGVWQGGASIAFLNISSAYRNQTISSHLNLTPFVIAHLQVGHAYELDTSVYAFVTVPGGWSRASFVLAQPFGARLNSLSLS
jgi:hypothetical protein